MKVYRKYIGVIPDNEERYFSMLSAVIESVDELSIMVIQRNPKDYRFQITPSEATFVPIIIKEINRLNNLYGLRVNFSKSMKSSCSVDFVLQT